jgi:hypothetical protein
VYVSIYGLLIVGDWKLYPVGVQLRACLVPKASPGERIAFSISDLQLFFQKDRSMSLWQILSEEDDGILKINKHELSLYIDRKSYLQPTEIDTPVG